MSEDRLPMPTLSVIKCQELLNDLLVSTGERELLKKVIQNRLAQCGWTYSMRKKYVEYIKTKGLDNINVSTMVADIVPEGLESFPPTVRKEMADLLWDFALKYITLDDSVQPPPDSPETLRSCSGFQYQTENAVPDPGLGENVPMPELILSRSPSPVTVPRPLTPQNSIPTLHPETSETDIGEDGVEEEENEISRSDDEEVSASVSEGSKSETEEGETGEEVEDSFSDKQNENVEFIEEEEEELMDI